RYCRRALFFFMMRRPARPPLFPYTTLFRSWAEDEDGDVCTETSGQAKERAFARTARAEAHSPSARRQAPARQTPARSRTARLTQARTSRPPLAPTRRSSISALMRFASTSAVRGLRLTARVLRSARARICFFQRSGFAA